MLAQLFRSNAFDRAANHWAAYRRAANRCAAYSWPAYHRPAFSEA